MSHLRLANGREILVQQADIELEIAGNELLLGISGYTIDLLSAVIHCLALYWMSNRMPA